MSGSFGSWQLDTLVAVGGLGEVWRAQRDGTIVALKRLHTHLTRNEEATRQFSVEQQLAVTLPPHANVVRGIEAGDVEGRPYVALELIEGEDLRRIVSPPASKKSLTPALAASAAPPTPPQVVIPRARVIQLVAAACDGVAHLHDAGWVHGDICPGNVMVSTATTRDRVVVIDLGVARAIGEAGAVRGTHAYMAPEQVKGGAWTRATDVFALGVVLWELTAGARLFHRGPPWLTMAAVVEEDVPPLSDPAIDAIARRALAKNQAERMQSAAELAAALRAL